jgi:hypothetical protein
LIFVVALAVATAAACDDDTTSPPEAGTVVVSLVTPNQDDGAIMVSVSGMVLTDPAAVSTLHEFYLNQASADSLVAVLAGDEISAGPLLTVGIADIRLVDELSVVILQVAAQDNSLRESLSGYDLTVALEEE